MGAFERSRLIMTFENPATCAGMLERDRSSVSVILPTSCQHYATKKKSRSQ
jgi:hypothetical protein